MQVVIVANAPQFDATPFRDLLARADLVIAADGGGNALHAINVAPHVVIGDLDSLTPAAEAFAVAAGAAIIRHPPEKDEIDLELALLHAVQCGADHIDILGAIGGRWDQSLANVALLALPELQSCRVRLLDVDQEAFLVRVHLTIIGTPGDTVSLLPIGGAAHGITTVGLQYALTNASLSFERTRGVSNVITGVPAEVSLREGMLLVIRQWSGAEVRSKGGSPTG